MTSLAHREVPCARHRGDVIPAQAVAKETRDKEVFRRILIWHAQVQVGLWNAYLTWGLGLCRVGSAVCASREGFSLALQRRARTAYKAGCVWGKGSPEVPAALPHTSACFLHVQLVSESWYLFLFQENMNHPPSPSGSCPGGIHSWL